MQFTTAFFGASISAAGSNSSTCGRGASSVRFTPLSTLTPFLHSLKLSVTAEGVETEMQLAALDALNCNQVQGFLLGRPTPKEGLPFYFARHDEVMAALATERAMVESPVTLAIAV